MILRPAVLAAALLMQALPSLAQEREWSVNTTGSQTYLVFGVPDTDDVGLSFWCTNGKQDVSAFIPEPMLALKKGQKLPMKLEVDGKATTVKAQADKDDATGVVTVEGKFGQKSALMQSLKNADAVTLTVQNHQSTYPLIDADFDGFIDACNGVAPDQN